MTLLGLVGIYATFVMTVVAEEDPSRSIWPSCPAPGWTNGVNRLTSIPNGSPLGLLPRATAPTAASKPPAMTLAHSSAASALAKAKANSTCVFQQNVDYDAGTFWVQPAANDQVLPGFSFLLSPLVSFFCGW
jgi:hypothetical protein